jgi:DNA-directed RNA polymerase specialized sigma subunit
MWSNNIGIMKNIEQLRKRDRGILRNIFGNNFNKKQIEEIMSQNMKISER